MSDQQMDALAERVKRPAADADGGRAAKRGTSSKHTQRFKVEDTLVVLLRDHLHLRNDFSQVRSALTYVFLLQSDEIKEAAQKWITTWTEQKPDQAKKKEEDGDDYMFEQHPMKCGRRTAVFGGILYHLADKPIFDKLDQNAQQVITSLRAVQPEMFDHTIAAFQSRHATPKKDRTWVWNLTLRPDGSDAAQAIRKLQGLQVRNVIRIDYDKGRQTPQQEQLWNMLKDAPRVQ